MNTNRIVERGWHWVDENARRSTLALARRLSRRSFLSRLGLMLTGAAALPLLPVARAFAAQETSGTGLREIGDPQTCEYWRYCALSGQLCSCCGGSHRSCPPGSEPSPITWVGTCRNPLDDREYLISYNDCCGKSMCGRCGCHNTEGDKPVYFNANSSTVIWCFGVENTSYHCTVALVLGEASE